MNEEVRMVLAPVEPIFSIMLNRRTRKAVREELLNLGGRYGNTEDYILGVPQDRWVDAQEIIHRAYPTWKIDLVDNRAMLRREGDNIKWTNLRQYGGYGTTRRYYGYVGTLRFFEICQKVGTRRGESGGYYLECVLDRMIFPCSDSSDSIEELEMIAEKRLKKFMGFIGATFKD